jgi:hypothetical protein
MQGLESLDKFKGFVSQLGGLGRYEDTYMVHAAEGETVIPMEVLDTNPVLKERLFETMRDMGIQPERYIVGNEFNSINPLTGQPEFFLKKIFRRLRKAKQDIGRRLRKGAADISGYAAPILGAMYGPAAGAAAGALLGQYKRENPGDPNQAMQMALRGGIAGLGTNLASGQGLSLGGGLRNIYNPVGDGTTFLQSLNPKTIGQEFLKNPLDAVLKDKVEGGNFLDRLRFMENFGFGQEGGATGTTGSDIVQSGKLNINKNIINSQTKDVSTSVLDKILKASGIVKPAALFSSIYSVYSLGNAIKKEQEEQAKERAENTGPFGERGTDEQLLALLDKPELVEADDTSYIPFVAKGGIMDLQDGGESKGPGTGTSDSIPAMLSDGEFVMTAKAVRGAGGGDRREGARKMYEAMDKLEAQG